MNEDMEILHRVLWGEPLPIYNTVERLEEQRAYVVHMQWHMAPEQFRRLVLRGGEVGAYVMRLRLLGGVHLYPEYSNAHVEVPLKEEA